MNLRAPLERDHHITYEHANRITARVSRCQKQNETPDSRKTEAWAVGARGTGVPGEA